MPAGEWLSESEQAQLDDVIRAAEQLCRAEFSVFVGVAEGDPHAFATSLHNTLVAPTRSILIMVDPVHRALEVITGGWVRRTLTDREVELTALAMQADFAVGDLAGGLRRGIIMLAEHARSPEMLHAGTDAES